MSTLVRNSKSCCIRYKLRNKVHGPKRELREAEAGAVTATRALSLVSEASEFELGPYPKIRGSDCGGGCYTASFNLLQSCRSVEVDNSVGGPFQLLCKILGKNSIYRAHGKWDHRWRKKLYYLYVYMLFGRYMGVRAGSRAPSGFSGRRNRLVTWHRAPDLREDARAVCDETVAVLITESRRDRLR